MLDQKVRYSLLRSENLEPERARSKWVFLESTLNPIGLFYM